MTQLSGTVAGVPFLALPPDRDPERAPLVVLWHLLGAPGTPEAMASALPLAEFPAWRLYLELPGSGRRPGPGAGDLLLDRYAPIIEQAVTELPSAVGAFRKEIGLAGGPVALVGGSAGGHAALVAAVRRQLPLAAVAVVNPAVRAESVMAVNERYSGADYGWSEASRAAAARLDVLRHVGDFPDAATLLLTGDAEYPEFQPDQSALYEALSAAQRPARHRIISGLAHMFADEPGDVPAPPLAAAIAIDAEITAWFARHLL